MSAPPTVNGTSTPSHLEDRSNLSQLLFVDSDQQFLTAILKDRKAALVPPLTSDQGSAAIELLSDPQRRISALFVGQNVRSPDALSVLRRARLLRPTLPMFLVCDDDKCRIDEATLKRLGNCEKIARSFGYAEIAQRFYHPSLLFDPNDTHGDGTAINEERNEADASFLSIRAETFVSGSKSVFDVYVRLGARRFLKILKAGDDFSRDRVDMYRKKGVAHFHIPKASQEAYLAYSHKLAENIIAHPAIPVAAKTRQAIAQGESVIELLKQKEVLTPEQLKFGETYVGLVHALVSQLDLEGQSTLVAALLNGPAHQEHFVSAILMGGLIARQLGFETEKSSTMIGMGCLLHDVGLFGDADGIELLEEAQMSDQQKSAYLEHPAKGARILKDLRGLNPVILQIVVNHHRRRNGTGFPNQSGLGAGKLTAPIEVVAAADELVRLCLRHASLGPEALQEKIRATILPAFSGEVSQAVMKVLGLKT
jgi:hypothetical protein